MAPHDPNLPAKPSDPESGLHSSEAEQASESSLAQGSKLAESEMLVTSPESSEAEPPAESAREDESELADADAELAPIALEPEPSAQDSDILLSTQKNCSGAEQACHDAHAADAEQSDNTHQAATVSASHDPVSEASDTSAVQTEVQSETASASVHEQPQGSSMLFQAREALTGLFDRQLLHGLWQSPTVQQQSDVGVDAYTYSEDAQAVTESHTNAAAQPEIKLPEQSGLRTLISQARKALTELTGRHLLHGLGQSTTAQQQGDIAVDMHPHSVDAQADLVTNPHTSEPAQPEGMSPEQSGGSTLTSSMDQPSKPVLLGKLAPLPAALAVAGITAAGAALLWLLRRPRTTLSCDARDSPAQSSPDVADALQRMHLFPESEGAAAEATPQHVASMAEPEQGSDAEAGSYAGSQLGSHLGSAQTRGRARKPRGNRELSALGKPHSPNSFEANLENRTSYSLVFSRLH